MPRKSKRARLTRKPAYWNERDWDAWLRKEGKRNMGASGRQLDAAESLRQSVFGDCR